MSCQYYIEAEHREMGGPVIVPRGVFVRASDGVRRGYGARVCSAPLAHARCMNTAVTTSPRVDDLLLASQCMAPATAVGSPTISRGTTESQQAAARLRPNILIK